MELRFKLNNKDVLVDVNPTIRLLDLLRSYFGLTGSKEGCGQGECGACTVIINGEAVNSCLVLAGQMEGCTILTIEALSENGQLDQIQQAFIDEGAIQCGYCTPGMIMSIKALFMRNPKPNEEEIKEAIEGNLCRCTGYKKIINAAKSVSEQGRNL